MALSLRALRRFRETHTMADAPQALGDAPHAAILAREYDIPAVVGTGAATELIHDGDIVCIDGTSGEVTW